MNTEYVRLRHSLRVFVEENALKEISVQTPSEADEVSFLRLIAWSYVLVFEAGRITIPYLLRLPSSVHRSQGELEAVCELIHDLRTWSFHNLSFSKERELAISRRTAMWFIRTSGTSPPRDTDGWRRCFEVLCAEVYIVLTHCTSAVEHALADTENGEKILHDLRRRLDRNWPANRFDELVIDAVTRIGQKLQVTRFRQARIAKWREFLEAIPDGDDPEALVVRLIERDVLDHFGSVLPIDGNDVIVTLGLAPGPEVGQALNNARKLYSSGLTDRDKLLAHLHQEHFNQHDHETLSTK